MNLKESFRGLLGYYPGIYLEGLRTITTTSAMIVSVPLKVRSEDLSNTSPECYNAIHLVKL
jgi:hypothetical protein